MKFIASFLLITLLYTSVNSEPINHRINFKDIRHEHESLDQAKLEVKNAISNVTNYENIVIESITDKDISWYSEEINSMPGCPEEPVRNLYAKIIVDNEFTREFKMFLPESFAKPRLVQIEWMGPCATLGRKRDNVDGSEIATGESTSESVLRNDELTTTGSFPAIEITQPPTTTEVNTSPSTIEPAESSSPSTSSMPVESSSPSDAGSGLELMNLSSGNEATSTSANLTTPAPSEGVSTEAVSPSTAPIGDPTEAPVQTPTTLSALLGVITRSSLTSTEPTTESSGATTEAAAPSEPPATTTTTTTTTPSPTTTTAAATTTTTLSATTFRERLMENTDAPSLFSEASTTTTETPATTTVASSAAILEESRVSSSAAGKYIGLSAAFLIFSAYLVFSRALRHQAMYEVHNE